MFDGVLNVDFLRSGKEFHAHPQEAAGTKRSFESSSTRNRNARLDAFYEKSLAAFESSDLDCWDGMRRSSAGPAAVTTDTDSTVTFNVDFLRSGGEFHPSEAAKLPMATFTAPEAAVPSPRTSRNERLRRFYEKSMASSSASTSKVADGATSTSIESRAGGELDAWDGMSVSAQGAVSNEPTIVNLDFLRSDAFKVTSTMDEAHERANRDVERVSKHARLEDFHRKTLNAYVH